MSKFHSTVSRRDFMKAMGLAGAGLGAAIAAAPVLHDLDEIAASPNSVPDLPWWVKDREFFDPTVPVDWDQKWRFDGRHARDYRDPDSDWYFNAYGEENSRRYTDYQNNFNPNFNWREPRRKALDAAARERGGITGNSFLGLPVTSNSWTPDNLGYPKWQGTPEENLRLLRGIVRLLGGDDVGVMEQDTHLMRLVCAYDSSGYKIDFEDVAEPDETTSPKRRLIPNSFRCAFTWTLRQPLDLTRRQEGGAMTTHPELNPVGVAENAAVWFSYSKLAITEHRIQTWLRGLGYQGVAGGMNAIMAGNAIATASGMLEHARMGQIAIHPKYGATVRGTYKMFTNLPLAPTKPIDAGIYKFCKTCGICAELCPGGIIQKGDPSWEPPEGLRPYQAAGFEGWRTDLAACPHCPVCQGTCPFNSMDRSFVHNAIKMTVANTTIFNSFFTQMHKTFDYGRKPEADYWEHWDKHPTYGFTSWQ